MVDVSKFSRTRTDRVYDKRLIKEEVRESDISRFLDLGCSNGEFTKEVADLLGEVEVYGREIKTDAAKAAQEKGIQMVNHDLNISPYPFRGDFFDLVISSQKIEHLYFTGRYLQEIRMDPKAKRYLLLTTVNLAALHYRIMLLFGVLLSCLHPSRYKVFPSKGEDPLYGHKSVFTHAALREILWIHGFTIIKDFTHSVYFMPRSIEKLFLRIFKNRLLFVFCTQEMISLS